MPPKKRKQIAIMIDPGDNWGREVVTGILSAVRNVLPWDLIIDPRDDEWRFRLPRNWAGDGVIGAIRDLKTARHLRSFGLPIINVSAWGGERDWGWHRVNSDDQVRAQMAFDHFFDRGYRNYAYYGPASQRYPASRGSHFENVVRNHGCSFTMFRSPATTTGWAVIGRETLKWLSRAPRPLAVFAADPHPAMRLTELCLVAGIPVPEEVAILAGDTDDLLCSASNPPLSSIILASHQIGVEAVHLLEGVLERRRNLPRTILLSPLGTINRQSTDVLAITDQDFVHALRYIREEAHLGIDVADVLRVVAISRRSLEQRFQQHLKRTPAEEIRRIKLQRAKQLLTSTDQTLEKIAASCGYSSVSHFCFTFRKVMQMSPQDFRHRSQRLGRTQFRS